MNCQGCAVHHSTFHSLFPSWGKDISLKLQAINKTQSRVLKPSNATNVKPTLKAIKQAATKIYEDINGPFQELFGMSFAKAQTKTPELRLQEKKSQAELRKQRRNTGQTRTVTPCWPQGRRTCSNRNSVLLYSLKHQRTQRIEVPNGKTQKIMASSKENVTRQSQNIFSLTRMGFCKKLKQ